MLTILGDNPHKFLFEAKINGQNLLLYREGMKFEQYAEIEYSPYFTIIENSIVSLGDKKVVKSLKSSNNELSEFMGSNKLKGKTPDELHEIFHFINREFIGKNSYLANDQI